MPFSTLRKCGFPTLKSLHTARMSSARANARVIELARSMSDEPHAAVVWNGEGGDGQGGTHDFVERLGHHGPGASVAIIDPTPRAYEAKQVRDGPKENSRSTAAASKVALSLEVLAAIERKLRERLGSPTLVLGDWFDYIGGTSTGAVIAAGLATGMPVEELRTKYASLASRVFSKRFLPLRLTSRYRNTPLETELETFFGSKRTLGDSELRSLLLIVLHNAATDSPWPLTGIRPAAKYNRADRYLVSPPDRNLDIPLAPLVHGSTAAPFYFSPQELTVGSHKFIVADGGMTPFNNPTLLIFLMATLPEYGLCWPAGENRILIVSVGTGSSPSAHPDRSKRRVDAVFDLKNAPPRVHERCIHRPRPPVSFTRKMPIRPTARPGGWYLYRRAWRCREQTVHLRAVRRRTVRRSAYTTRGIGRHLAPAPAAQARHGQVAAATSGDRARCRNHD